MGKGKTKEFWWTKEKVLKMNDLRVAENLSLEEVGQKYGVRRQRVQQLFKKFGIPVRYRRKPQEVRDELFVKHKLIPKDTLIKLYVDQRLKMREIAKVLHISDQTLKKSLRMHEIPKRKKPLNRPPSPLTYDLLYKMYIEGKMTAKEIARKLGYATITVQRRLSFLEIKNNKYGWKTRPQRTRKLTE